MKILLASDSHGDDDILKKLIKMNPDVDLYLHCGDSESYPQEIFPFISVRGNTDHYSEFIKSFIINTPYGVLLMEHGPFTTLKELNDQNVKIFCYGHTHKRTYSKHDGIVFVNPGSVSYPRDGKKPSYAILTITEKECKVKFCDII